MRFLAALAVMTLAIGSAQAQATRETASSLRAKQESAPVPAKDARTTIAEMKAALRNLVVAQEKYWMDHGTYTTDGAALGTYPYKNGQPWVQVIFAGSRGWTGVASDRTLKGKSCVIYAGNDMELPGGVPKTAAAGIPSNEGEPTCDEL